MKKIFIFLFTLLASYTSQAQVTSTPAFPTEDQPVTIYFDATGTPLAASTSDIYMHAGVVTDQSNGNWTYVKTAWGENAASCRLTKVSGEQYKVEITPSIRSFYNVPAGEKVLKLAFVFRNAAASAQTQDVFYKLYEPGLHIRIDSPTTSPLITSPETFAIKAVASQTSAMTITVDGNELASANAIEVSGSYTANTAGVHTIVASATKDGETVTASRLITYKGVVVSQPVPAGMHSGINYSADGTSATLVFDTPIKYSTRFNEYITDVYLIGEFNNWTPQAMYRSTSAPSINDRWWFTVTGLTPGEEYAFQYMVTNKGGITKRLADPYANKIMDQWNDKWINQAHVIYPGIEAFPEEHTTGIAAVLQPGKTPYNWTDQDFVGPNNENLLVYELLLRDFTEEKTVAAAEAKLDYLKNLGVNVIELMPITDFDGNDSWGYNPMFFYAADKAYGREIDYKHFIDACHERGIAVVLDMVFNHATGSNPLAALYWDSAVNKTSRYNPWFNVDAPHKYSVFHDFNHTFQGTKDYLMGSLKYWMQEYHIDGFRMDLAKGFMQTGDTDGYNEERIGILKEYYDYAKAINPNVYFILEHLGDANELKVLCEYGMLSWGKMLDTGKQCNLGYASGSDLRAASSKLSWGWSVDHNVAYQESHDEERQGYYVQQYGVDKGDDALSFQRMAATAAIFSAIPGPKMIYEFEELAYDYSINYDPEKGQNVADGKLIRKEPHWEWTEDADRQEVYKAYSRIMTLRNTYPQAFIDGAVDMQVSASDWSQGKRVCIQHSSCNVVIVANMQGSSISANMNFPHIGTWYDISTNQPYEVTAVNQSVGIPARSYRCYTDKQVPVTGVEDAVQIDEQAKVVVVYDKSAENFEFYVNQEIQKIDLYAVNGSKVASVTEESYMNVSGLTSGCYIARLILSNGSVVTCKATK